MSDNQSLGAEYYVKHVTIISVFSAIASVAVILRCCARRIQNMSLELNDYLIVLGLLCALGESAINIYGCCFGMVKLQSQEDIQRAIIFSQKAQFIGPIVWVASVTFIRASIVFLYIRIFPTRLFRKVCYLILVINLVFFVGTILADCLICQPISYRWTQMTGGTGHCGYQKSLDLFIGIFNLLLDVTVVVLPMPVLWGLKMALGQKIMLTGMFGMGVTICALTLYRIYATTTIIAANAQTSYALIALLTSLEALFGVINACLPVLKPIFNKMRGTAPQRGNGSGVREILKSGTIPIFMRMSHVWTLASGKGKYTSSDEETLTETPRRYEVKTSGRFGTEGGKGPNVTAKQISPPMTKAERVMGLSAPQIHVKRDVDVESVASRDEMGLAGERRQERW